MWRRKLSLPRSKETTQGKGPCGKSERCNILSRLWPCEFSFRSPTLEGILPGLFPQSMLQVETYFGHGGLKNFWSEKRGYLGSSRERLTKLDFLLWLSSQSSRRLTRLLRGDKIRHTCGKTCRSTVVSGGFLAIMSFFTIILRSLNESQRLLLLAVQEADI